MYDNPTRVTFRSLNRRCPDIPVGLAYIISVTLSYILASLNHVVPAAHFTFKFCNSTCFGAKILLTVSICCVKFDFSQRQNRIGSLFHMISTVLGFSMSLFESEPFAGWLLFLCYRNEKAVIRRRTTTLTKQGPFTKIKATLTAYEPP